MIYHKFVLFIDKIYLITMQLKFSNEPSLKQSIISKLIKTIIFTAVLILIIFLIDKINFPYPQKEIKNDITNEIIKLK